MAKRPCILFILVLLSTLYSSASADLAQTGKSTFFETIRWNPQASHPELPFHGTGYFDENSGIPVYRTSFPLPEDFVAGTSVIKQLVLQPLRWKSSIEDQYLTDISSEDLADSLTYRVVTIQKKAFLEIETIPYRKSFNQEDSWEQLIQFSVNLTYSPQSSHSLKATTSRYTRQSRLASGSWIKIGTRERGIHKIPYSTLQSWGFSNPSRVQVFGNGGAMVPMQNSDDRPDDLPALACLHSNDALFFYSAGTWRWHYDSSNNIFNYEKHKFSPMAFFFLSEVDEAIKTPVTIATPNGTVTHTTNTFDALYFHESDNENVLNSGNKWFGEKFNTTIALERNFEVDIPNLLPQQEAIFFTQVAGRSNSAQNFNIAISESASLTVPITTVSMNDYLGYYLRLASGVQSFVPGTSRFNVRYQYNNPASTSIGWLDYFIINGRGKLTLENGPIVFRDKQITASGNITTWQIAGATTNDIVWDVTNPADPMAMETTYRNGQLEFTTLSNNLREYVAFNPAQSFFQPELIGQIGNQNLHATSPAEMVIVAPAEFIPQAQRLASLHSQHSNLTVTVAERDKIYNEFSWGHPDPGAIRGFMKMLYDRAGDNEAETPKLLLLFGDGTYDNRHLDNTPAAPLPTYQSDNSIYQTGTFVTDDYFGFLDDNEGADLRNDRLDIGIGRFPVTTLEQAVNAVNKSENYLLNQEQGKWKTKLTFIGDDGDFNIHVRDADRLTQKIAANHYQFDINKIYFDAYKMTTGASGKDFPEAKNQIMQSIADGTLVLNYTGHGSENNLAHEKIITRGDIINWNNKNKLPLFITATCEFSRFDNHNHTSSGEEVFLNPNGGGIALLSTTRIVYSSLNFTLNNAFYNHAFEKDEQGLPLRLGEMMRRTKLESGSNTNKLNFTLLGDPALRLIYPANNVNTASLNNIEITEQPDTISALSKNRISGSVTDPQGNPLTDFSGTLAVTVFDKAVEAKTLGNGSNEPFEYDKFSNILFQGTVTVRNGDFSFEFVVPKDIRYNFDNGRISYYAIAEDGKEAAGAFTDVVIGGINNAAGNDAKGPEINMYLNHPDFAPGQTTGSRPVLYADLFDESGINTSGIGIGHNITLIIDEDTNNPTILNDAFTADTDSYQQGNLAWQLPFLEEGNHTLTLKVWDNYNNSSTGTLSFRVSNNHGLNLQDFSIWPNPVTPGQDVYITMHTDAANSLIDATIQFVNSSGKVTGSAEEEIISTGNQIGPYRLPIEKAGWDYRHIHFVRIILKPQNGEEKQVVAKLLPIH